MTAMKASDIMTLGAATTTATSSLTAAIKCMSDHRISALPVLDEEERLVGLVTEGDFSGKILGLSGSMPWLAPRRRSGHVRWSP